MKEIKNFDRNIKENQMSKRWETVVFCKNGEVYVRERKTRREAREQARRERNRGRTAYVADRNSGKVTLKCDGWHSLV